MSSSCRAPSALASASASPLVRARPVMVRRSSSGSTVWRSAVHVCVPVGIGALSRSAFTRCVGPNTKGVASSIRGCVIGDADRCHVASPAPATALVVFVYVEFCSVRVITVGVLARSSREGAVVVVEVEVAPGIAVGRPLPRRSPPRPARASTDRVGLRDSTRTTGVVMVDRTGTGAGTETDVDRVTGVSEGFGICVGVVIVVEVDCLARRLRSAAATSVGPALALRWIDAAGMSRSRTVDDITDACLPCALSSSTRRRGGVPRRAGSPPRAVLLVTLDARGATASSRDVLVSLEGWTG
jgi:hypothetical protein